MAKQQIVLFHQNELTHSKEYLFLRTPKELHIVFWCTVSMLVILLGFLFFGKIDDVIKVSGIVKTKQNVSAVLNVIDGRIDKIYFTPDQKVAKGDVLYTLDSAIYTAQRNNLLFIIEDNKKRLEDCNQLILSYEKGKNYVNKETNPLGYSQFEAYLSELNILTLQEEQSFLVYTNEINNPVSLQVKKKIEAAKLDYDICSAKLHDLKVSFIKTLLETKEKIQLDYDRNIEDLKKMDEQYKFLTIRAPIDGYVQEVSSLNSGDYLSAGKNVLNIIPDDEKNFRIELHLTQKDAGKIRDGLKVKYRLTAFPFFEYKGAEGIIQTVDSDVRISENGLPYYNAYGDIDKLEFENRKGQHYPIKPGLAVDARIVLETETIITFILKKLDLFY